jgi:predicted DNA-binding transcriptional regulator AlpA
MLGLARPNLQRLIRQGRIPVPKPVKISGVTVRLWTRRDVEKVRRALRKKREVK